jgi:hypothetical protein
MPCWPPQVQLRYQQGDLGRQAPATTAVLRTPLQAAAAAGGAAAAAAHPCGRGAGSSEPDALPSPAAGGGWSPAGSSEDAVEAGDELLRVLQPSTSFQQLLLLPPQSTPPRSSLKHGDSRARVLPGGGDENSVL